MAKALWGHEACHAGCSGPCQDVGPGSCSGDVDRTLPVQWCWPEDAAPLLTWGLVVTSWAAGVPNPRRQNPGIYRQQLIGRRQLIMRWLTHRGGVPDFREFALANPGNLPDCRPGRRPR